MKKKLIFLVILLAFASCNGVIPIDDDPVVIPDPILTLSVSHDTVSSGDVVTISVVAVNATRTESNINDAPKTTNWSYDIIVKEDFEILVSAYNSVGIKIQESHKITVLVPYVPNRTDSLCSMVWSLKARDVLDENGNIIFSDNLNDQQLTKKYYYYKDGITKAFDKNGTLISGPYDWKWTGTNTILNGDQTYRYSLDGTKLCLYQSSNDGTQISRITYVGVKI